PEAPPASTPAPAPPPQPPSIPTNKLVKSAALAVDSIRSHFPDGSSRTAMPSYVNSTSCRWPFLTSKDARAAPETCACPCRSIVIDILTVVASGFPPGSFDSHSVCAPGTNSAFPPATRSSDLQLPSSLYQSVPLRSSTT